MPPNVVVRPLPLHNPDGSVLGAVDGWDQPGAAVIIDNSEPLVYLDLVAPAVASRPAYHVASYRPRVRAGVAHRLQQAQESLVSGYQLVLLDGWRPRAIQRRLYRAELAQQLAAVQAPDQSGRRDPAALHAETARYVVRSTQSREAPAPHSTGGAVDVALLFEGQMVDFGSEFDEFSPRSSLTYYEQHDENRSARQHRRILYHAMTRAGFEPYQYEWWHYNYGNQMATIHYGHRSGDYFAPMYGAVSAQITARPC